MRTVLRVGIILGLLGGALAYLAARFAAFTVAGVLFLVGILAGLAVAKWLEWTWYGRQTEATLKATGTAVVLTAAGALAGFFTAPHRDTAAMVRESHLGRLSFEKLAASLAFAGPVAGPVLGVLLTGAIGFGLGVLATWVFAWDKSLTKVHKVAQARLAAQALRRGWHGTTPVPTLPSSITAGPAWQAIGSSPPAVNIPSGPLSMTGAPIPGAPPIEEPQKDWRTLPPAPSHSREDPDSSSSRRRKKVNEGPVELGSLAETGMHPQADDARLKDAMREAMAMWSSDEKSSWTDDAAPDGEVEEDDQPTERRKRAAAKSEFLNSGNTGKSKARKKNDTRDWLC
jgi:hypothetical protein